MIIEDCILVTYPTVHPNERIKSIENRLKEKDYLVVKDEKNKFYGILTPADVLTRPSTLVIDCLTPKGIIQADDSFGALVGKFENTPSEALPVFQHGEYLGILEKNDALKKLKYRLDDFRKELMISQKIKSSFLQNISHEIRTPLNHILGFMSIIADLSSGELEPNGEEFYTIIRKSSEQFLSIMNDLIELSRLYSGDKVTVHNENTLVESVFSNIKANFEDNAILYSGDLNISYRNPDITLAMCTDSKKLELIIHRLINHLLQQKRKNDRIEFGCQLLADKQDVRFFVKKTNDQIHAVSGNSSPNTTGENFCPKYSFQFESNFRLELSKKMVELLGGVFQIEESESDIQSVYFTIPYKTPQ